MLVTVFVVVATRDLSKGVLAGVMLSGIFLAAKVRHMFGVERESDGARVIYRVTGQLFFASVDRFAAAFFGEERADHVTIDFSAAHFWDISAIGALDRVVVRLRGLGKRVVVIGANRASADLIDRFGLHYKTGFETGAVPH